MSTLIGVRCKNLHSFLLDLPESRVLQECKFSLLRTLLQEEEGPGTQENAQFKESGRKLTVVKVVLQLLLLRVPETLYLM